MPAAKEGGGNVPALGFLDLSRVGAAHLYLALQAYRKALRAEGRAFPDELTELERCFASRARRVQEGPPFAPTADLAHSETVSPSPLLVDYADAAVLLKIGLSSLKRLVQAGDLVPVHIGRSARLRVVDVEAYIERLTEQAA